MFTATSPTASGLDESLEAFVFDGQLGKHATLYWNGSFADGKSLVVQPLWTMQDLYRVASQRLGMPVSRIYVKDGVMLQDPSCVDDHEVLFASQGEPFKNPSTARGAEPGTAIGGYIIGKLLGQGGFGVVRLGRHQFTEDVVALKFLPKRALGSTQDAERVLTEIRCLMELVHENIVKLIDVVDASKDVVLVLEYAPCGDLKSHLKTFPGGRLPEAAARTMFRQIVKAVSFAHAHNISHRDLKLENILIGSDGSPKITDFGLSLIMKPHETTKSTAGSLCYLAPELIVRSSNRGAPIDVWCLGIILFALLTGALPFQLTTKGKDDLFRRIAKGEFKLPDTLSSEAQDLIRMMLRTDPESRISLPAVAVHRWLRLDDTRPLPPYTPSGTSDTGFLTLRSPVGHASPTKSGRFVFSGGKVTAAGGGSETSHSGGSIPGVPPVPGGVASGDSSSTSRSDARPVTSGGPGRRPPAQQLATAPDSRPDAASAATTARPRTSITNEPLPPVNLSHTGFSSGFGAIGGGASKLTTFSGGGAVLSSERYLGLVTALSGSLASRPFETPVYTRGRDPAPRVDRDGDAVKPCVSPESPRKSSSLYAPTASSYARDIAKADDRMRRNARIRSRVSREGVPSTRETSADASPTPTHFVAAGGLTSSVPVVDVAGRSSSPSLRNSVAMKAIMAMIGFNDQRMPRRRGRMSSEERSAASTPSSMVHGPSRLRPRVAVIAPSVDDGDGPASTTADSSVEPPVAAGAHTSSTYSGVAERASSTNPSTSASGTNGSTPDRRGAVGGDGSTRTSPRGSVPVPPGDLSPRALPRASPRRMPRYSADANTGGIRQAAAAVSQSPRVSASTMRPLTIIHTADSSSVTAGPAAAAVRSSPKPTGKLERGMHVSPILTPKKPDDAMADGIVGNGRTFNFSATKDAEQAEDDSLGRLQAVPFSLGVAALSGRVPGALAVESSRSHGSDLEGSLDGSLGWDGPKRSNLASHESSHHSSHHSSGLDHLPAARQSLAHHGLRLLRSDSENSGGGYSADDSSVCTPGITPGTSMFPTRPLQGANLPCQAVADDGSLAFPFPTAGMPQKHTGRSRPTSSQRRLPRPHSGNLMRFPSRPDFQAGSGGGSDKEDAGVPFLPAAVNPRQASQPLLGEMRKSASRKSVAKLHPL